MAVKCRNEVGVFESRKDLFNRNYKTAASFQVCILSFRLGPQSVLSHMHLLKKNPASCGTIQVWTWNRFLTWADTTRGWILAPRFSTSWPDVDVAAAAACLVTRPKLNHKHQTYKGPSEHRSDTCSSQLFGFRAKWALLKKGSISILWTTKFKFVSLFKLKLQWNTPWTAALKKLCFRLLSLALSPLSTIPSVP